MEQNQIDFKQVKLFLLSSSDYTKVATTLRAITAVILQAQDSNKLIQNHIRVYDILGCLDQEEHKQEECVIDHLLRSKSVLVRCQTFELLSTLSAFKEGKKYLLLNKDFLKFLIESLSEIPAESAAQMKGLQSSEVMEHRWLLITLFRLSQSRASHQYIMQSVELT